MLTINDFKPRDPEEAHTNEEQFSNHWPMCVCYEVLWDIYEKLGPDYTSRIEFNAAPNAFKGSLNIEWYLKDPDRDNKHISWGYLLPGHSRDTRITTIHQSLRYFGQRSYNERECEYRDYRVPTDMRKFINAYQLVCDYKTWSAQADRVRLHPREGIPQYLKIAMKGDTHDP